MVTLAEPPALKVIRRAGRPENDRTHSWVAPEEFFRNIRYVTIKVTNGCNLKCSYCNVDADVPSTPRISMETYKRIADLLIKNSVHEEVGLEFHGGEPLIMPDEFFQEAVAYAADLAKKYGKKKIMHPMQTNATKLTEEKLEMLQGLGIDVGISCDGPPDINDQFRMAGKRVEQALKMLVKRRSAFGMILVLSKGNCNHMYRIMEYFRELGVQGFRFNFLQPQGLGMEHSLLSTEEMFAGVKGVFDHMADTECSVVEANTQMLVNRFAFGRNPSRPLSCWELECQAGRTYCAVNLEGDVFSCGTDISKHRLGHIDDGFNQENINNTLCGLHKKDAWYTRCFDCDAKRICSLSCPTSDFNDIRYRDSECGYTRAFFRYLTENPEKVYSVLRGIGEKRPMGYFHL